MSKEQREVLIRSISSASRRIWALSAPEHGLMMVRADDAERIMREEILGETFSSSPDAPPPAPAETPARKRMVCSCGAMKFPDGLAKATDGRFIHWDSAAQVWCGPVVEASEGGKG